MVVFTVANPPDHPQMASSVPFPTHLTDRRDKREVLFLIPGSDNLLLQPIDVDNHRLVAISRKRRAQDANRFFREDPLVRMNRQELDEQSDEYEAELKVWLHELIDAASHVVVSAGGRLLAHQRGKLHRRNWMNSAPDPTRRCVQLPDVSPGSFAACHDRRRSAPHLPAVAFRSRSGSVARAGTATGRDSTEVRSANCRSLAFSS